MQRLRSSLFLVLLAAVCLAQSGSQLQSEAVRRVGSKLACLCGTCNNTVATCPMLECHFANPARIRIATLLAAGKSDSDIIDEFVKEYGLQVLAAPPTEGFSLLAWVMPWVGIAFGLAMVWLFVQRFRKPAPAADSPADSENLARYRDRIEKDLAKLD
jgi:cytochrome c-type biogenesis protein CcmH/NrfF